MRDWFEGWGWFVCALVILSLSMGLIVYFDTNPTTIVLSEEVPREIMIELYQASPQDRLWFDEAGVLPGSEIIYITYKTRFLERDRVGGFLDTLGVDYAIIKEGE